MLKPDQKVAVFMQGYLHSDFGKMGLGVLRYLTNPIVGVIDSEHAGSNINLEYDLDRDVPICATLNEVIEKGAEVLILGIAPSGGQIPQNWMPVIEAAILKGLSIVNGLHDNLNDKFKKKIQNNVNQWIWDVRTPQFVPDIATAKASDLPNKRVLMIGTDMAVGKMTAGLEIYHWAKQRKINTGFIATGQIGITITGKGVPLDALKVDHACGAIEQLVLDQKDNDLLIIEGQGSLLHPGSTATLPLMRGSCPTHMILCHRADKTTLRNPESIRIPNLKEFIQLNEAMASACGTFGHPKVIGIALNTAKFSVDEARENIRKVEKETGLPVTDVIRFGVEKIMQGLG